VHGRRQAPSLLCTVVVEPETAKYGNMLAKKKSAPTIEAVLAVLKKADMKYENEIEERLNSMYHQKIRLESLYSNKFPEEALMRMESARKKIEKCAHQLSACAIGLKPIIFMPSFSFNSFSWTRALIMFTTGYIRARTIKIAKREPTEDQKPVVI